LGFAVNNYPNVLEFLPPSGLNSEGFLTELKEYKLWDKSRTELLGGPEL
jgi:hypothetical protein